MWKLNNTTSIWFLFFDRLVWSDLQFFIKSNNSNQLVRNESHRNNSNSNWIDDFITISVRRKKRRERNEPFIKICFILFFYSFHFCFSFHFSDLSVNNLNGAIPTQIGLMTSLQQLWEEKKKRERNEPFIKICFILFFSFCFYFILVILSKII